MGLEWKTIISLRKLPQCLHIFSRGVCLLQNLYEHLP